MSILVRTANGKVLHVVNYFQPRASDVEREFTETAMEFRARCICGAQSKWTSTRPAAVRDLARHAELESTVDEPRQASNPRPRVEVEVEVVHRDSPFSLLIFGLAMLTFIYAMMALAAQT